MAQSPPADISVALPPASAPAISPNSTALAAAAEARTRQQAVPVQTASQIAEEHEKRQAFRRLVEPGIMRPNSYEVAMASLKTLLTISENLLREPDNPKFQQFKPTNNTIKARLIEPKGALEFAIALGFRPEVQNFQPFYVFNPRKMSDLRIGSVILKEYVDLELSKQERAGQSKKEEKAAIAAAALKVKLAYFDDRKSKELHDQRERELRNARAIVAAQQEAARQSAPTESDPTSSATPSIVPAGGPARGSARVVKVRNMPGTGRSVGGNEVTTPDPTSADSEEEEESDDDDDMEP